jgi:hypothetical protein
MGALEGRVAIITGAGRGIGREHALLFASEGAKVVVNDLGGGLDGSSQEATPAEEVVAEIRAMGAEAVANHDNVATWDGGERLIQCALENFGDLHVLVNNAGILRDRVLVNLSESDWDANRLRPARSSRRRSLTPRLPRGFSATSASRTTARPRPESRPLASSLPKSSVATVCA